MITGHITVTPPYMDSSTPPCPDCHGPLVHILMRDLFADEDTSLLPDDGQVSIRHCATCEHYAPMALTLPPTRRFKLN